jgi:hypothetical protein
LTHIILDTNVLVTANKDGEIEPQLASCISSCLKLVSAVLKGQYTLVLDEEYILREYGRQALLMRDGLGKSLLVWIYSNLNNPGVCESVIITPANGSFAEFHQDDALAGFDKADHKFVAVALSHHAKPPIYNAVDSDWAQHYPALSKYVRIEFLCPDVVAQP